MNDDELDVLVDIALDEMRRRCRDLAVLTVEMEFRGQRFVATYVAPVGDRDLMEMTLGEWQAYPLLAADVMLSKVVEDHRHE